MNIQELAPCPAGPPKDLEGIQRFILLGPLKRVGPVFHTHHSRTTFSVLLIQNYMITESQENNLVLNPSQSPTVTKVLLSL